MLGADHHMLAAEVRAGPAPPRRRMVGGNNVDPAERGYVGHILNAAEPDPGCCMMRRAGSSAWDTTGQHAVGAPARHRRKTRCAAKNAASADRLEEVNYTRHWAVRSAGMMWGAPGHCSLPTGRCSSSHSFGTIDPEHFHQTCLRHHPLPSRQSHQTVAVRMIARHGNSEVVDARSSHC